MNYSLACFSSYQRIRAVEITRSQFHSRCSALNCTCKIGCLDKYDEPRERGSCSCQGRAQGSLHCGEGGEPGVETVTPALVRLQTSRGARGLPARGLTAQPQQLNDLLPLVSPPSPRALGHMASGRAGCSARGWDCALQPSLTSIHPTAGAGCCTAKPVAAAWFGAPARTLGCFPSPAPRGGSWRLPGLSALWPVRGSSAALSSPFHRFTGIRLSEQLISVSNVQA